MFLGCSASTVVSGSCSLAGDETQLVYSGLVGKDASVPVEENCMPYVTAGDPTRSYLMHKLDGDMCVVDCCITNNTPRISARINPSPTTARSGPPFGPSSAIPSFLDPMAGNFDVAGHYMHGLFLTASLAGKWTAWMKHATGRRCDRAR